MIFPPILSEEVTSNTINVSLDLQPNLVYFDGHFDEAGVLAGVVQLGWVIALVEKYFKEKLDFVGMPSVKFTKLVIPPCSLDLQIQYQPEKGLIKFKGNTPTGKCSAGGIKVKSRDE